MRKTMLTASMLSLAAGVFAQDKGTIEIFDFDKFRLHVYYTNDALADASYIVEGRDSVVTMEQPLFKDNVSEFDTYLESLGKPVEKRIADYHVGGTAHHDVIMPSGMPGFTEEGVYAAMMDNFGKMFGDALSPKPTGKIEEVSFGSSLELAGIPFEFRHGASSDFPGASILIGGDVYYTHWAPARAHASHLQISSRAAVAAELAEGENALTSGASLFIGGHGRAAGKDVLEFKIDYLKTLQALMSKCTSSEEFATLLDEAFPGLPGKDEIPALAAALYK